ncbi:PTS sugar transporter [Microbacterium sp. GXF7504]
MRILVVCGAGASSTFVAQRLRAAAQAAGLDVDAAAVSRTTLSSRLPGADALLIGPHLPDLDEVRAEAERLGVRAITLPDDAFTDLDGSRALRLITPTLSEGQP